MFARKSTVYLREEDKKIQDLCSSDSQALQAFEGIFVKYMENWLRLNSIIIQKKKKTQ
jgi:hypothetical protein